MARYECFKYRKVGNKQAYRHYTELDNGIASPSKSYKEIAYHTGSGIFKVYKFTHSTKSTAVRNYLRSQYPGATAIMYTLSVIENIYSKFGNGTYNLNILDPKGNKGLVSFGRVKCPPGIAPPVPGEPKPENPPPHITPGSGIQKQTIRNFTVNSSTFHIDINYETFLCYGSINDTISRGKAKLYLYKGNTLIDTILNIDYNDSRSISLTYEGMVAGEYRLVMELEDTYQDTKQIYFNVNTQIRETKTTVNGTGERDDSRYTMHVLNKVGQKVDVEGQLDVVMNCTGSCVKCISIEVPKGETYTLTGYMFKPSGITIGGPYDSGAAIEMSEGSIKYNVITRAFPSGEPIVGGSGGVSGNQSLPEFELPIPGWGVGDPEIDEGGGDEGERQGDFFWVDVIEVVSAEGPEIDMGEVDSVIESHVCYPLGTYMNVNVQGMDYGSFMEANQDLRVGELISREIGIHLTNPSESDIVVEFDFDVDDNFEGCGGGGEIDYFGGGFEFWGYDRIVGDDLEDTTEMSRVDVTIEEYLPNHITIGGCNGSFAEVNVKHKGNIVKKFRIDEDTKPRIPIDNLFTYGDTDFEIEVITHQKGVIDPRGYDLRSMFSIREVKLESMFELNATNFDSKLDFYINDELKFTSDRVGSGEHYFNVNKGLNRYKFVFSTNHYNYNWDYVEIPWIRLTNWLCDAHEVIPYCDKGRGDKCVEALIGCVLGLLPPVEPKGCIVITYIDHETGQTLRKFTQRGYVKGEYVIEAQNYPEFEVVGEKSQTVLVDETGICTPITFYYRRTHRRCVYVYHMNCETGTILKKVPYYNLVPGKHYFNPIEIPNYRARIIDPIEFEAINTLIPIECEPIYICYDWVGDKNPYLDCLYVIHREYGNIENILETEQLINLAGGQLEVHAKEYTGYRVIGPEVKFVNMRDITDPLECLEVTFDYEKIPLDCVIVKFVDRVSEEILDTDFYYGLLPGEYTYNAKAFDGYKLVSEKSYTILLIEEMITDDCKELTFLYESISKGCALGKKIWLFT